MNLAARQALQSGQVEGFTQSVDTSVLEKLVTSFVNNWAFRVALEVARSWNLSGEVISCIEELEETSDCVEIFVNEVDSALLSRKTN